MFFTPEMAVAWLAVNIDRNRNMRKSRINGYVRDIQSERWVVTGEAIKFDTAGRLIDGQNRCQAIVAAGKGAWVLVVRGISEEALIVLDSGSARNTRDKLVITSLADRADAKDVGAIARLCTAAVDGWTLGLLERVVTGTKPVLIDEEQRYSWKDVAAAFGVSNTVFQTQPSSLIVLLNLVAHHSRLWTQPSTVSPKKSKLYDQLLRGSEAKSMYVWWLTWRHS